MKKVALIALILLGFTTLSAQNIQLHYDFGQNIYGDTFNTRSDVTATLEHLSFDKWGSTFYFVDLDITSQGVNQAYAEIMREIKLGSQSPLSFHVEYNGGLFNSQETGKGYLFNNCYLTGLTYGINSKDFTKGISFSLMYKYIEKLDQAHNAQFTTVWYYNFLNKACTFNGFADVWSEDSRNTKVKFISEPQFWVNLDKIKALGIQVPISIGTELEISAGFYNSEIYCIPTLGMKWNF